MTNEELTTKYEPIVKATRLLQIKEIMGINHRPHMYMVGSKHVVHASDHCGGKLGEETMKAIPCAHPRCGMAYEDHTYDTVMGLELTCDTTGEEVQKALKIIVDGNDMEDDGIDGFIFVENKFKMEQ